MEAITVKELLAAVHGELLQGEGTTKILGVNTDSRTVKSGEVFLPLVGERFDGHDYIEKALSAGAEQPAVCKERQREENPQEDVL